MCNYYVFPFISSLLLCSTGFLVGRNMYLLLSVEATAPHLIQYIKIKKLFCSPPCLNIQLSVDLSGPDGTMSFRARGVNPEADLVSCIFSGEGVETLMDLRWHKVALSVQQGSVSLHVDCSSIETQPLELRGVLPTNGHTLLGIRASDAGPVQVI